MTTHTPAEFASMTEAAPRDRLLRRALLADAALEAALGAGALLLGPTLATWFGLADAALFTLIGFVLLLAAGGLYALGRAAVIPRGLVWAVIIANEVTALACIGISLFLGANFAPAAHIVLWLVAIDLIGLAALEFVGLRRAG